MRIRPFPATALAAATMMLFVAGAQADLDATQKQLYDDAIKHIGQGEANFKVASDGATGNITGSRGRLTLSRLAAVKTSIATVNARLGKLPADEAQVQALKARVDQLQKSVTDMETAIANPGAAAKPDAKPGAAPDPAKPQAQPKPPADAGTKLDYKQEENLKNARFHTRDVTGKAAAIAQVAETVTKAADPLLVPIGTLQAAVNTIEDVHRKEKFADDALAPLPADGRGVQEVADQLKESKASVAASEKVIIPAYDKLVAALDPKNHPTLAEDIKRLGELASMYANADVFISDRPRAAAAVIEIPQAAKEHDRIVKDYALLMQQQTDAGKRLIGTSTHFKEKLGAFIELAKQQKQALPGEIEADLKRAGELSDQAVKEQKPAFFTGGIPQQMDFAADKLVLLQAIDADAAKLAADRITGFKAELAKKQQALSEGIINSNTLPNDAYTNADRKKIETLAIEAWKKEQPEAEVLMVRIPSQNWKRETMWRFQNSWYFIDRSKLQAQLIVKHNDKLAVIRPINLWIDHTSNDEHKAFPMDGIADDLIPQRFMLLEKVK